MENSQISKIFVEKLTKIQNELKVPKDKGGKNDKTPYKYRSLEDIFEKVKPLLAKEQLCLFVSDEVREVGGRIYITATATLRDENGYQIESKACANEDSGGRSFMSPAQLSGATSSYARKNALCGLFLLDDNRDIDDNDYQKHAQNSQMSQKLNAVSTKNGNYLKMLKLKREVAEDLVSRGVEKELLVEFFGFVGVNKDDYNSLLSLNNGKIGDLNELVARFNNHKGGQSI